MDPAVLREDMVDGVEEAVSLPPDLGVAMREVPRHVFVPDRPYDNRDTEYEGSRVLAPRTVARLLVALDPEPGDRTLVVGAGVGYTAAVLAELVGERNVHAIDITRRLVVEARKNLAEVGYDGVLVDRRDGADGLPEYAPYDRVLLEAAAVRPPATLVDQLADDGRLVMPHGAGEQTLVAVESSEITEQLGTVAFRPMLVEGEQADTVERNRTRREDREFARRNAQSRAGWEQDWIEWDSR